VQRIRLEELKPGMVVAKPIYDQEGRVLLNRGVVLRDSLIDRLRQIGCPAVYIDVPLAEGIVLPDMLKEETRAKSISQLRKAFDDVQTGQSLDLDAIKDTVINIIDEVLANARILVNLTDIRTYDSYTFGHCVNVCVLSILTGHKLQLNELEMRDLAVGAILHDIGKVKVPKEVLQKPGPLTEEEFELVKKHTTHGFDILRHNNDLSILIAHIAYQHHERLQGQGYPRGLKDSQIHKYAQIVAVADSFDAMTSERVYRGAIPPVKAVATLREMSGDFFAPEVVEALVSTIAIYPIGSWVRLTSGHIGVVVDVNNKHPNLPVVRLVFNPRGEKIGTLTEVDLITVNDLFIESVFLPEEMEALGLFNGQAWPGTEG
jgi:HD-GYP domain-containing protein (c-di-GMP phosphodiesterase class II)